MDEQTRDVFLAVAKGRRLQGENVEPIVEVGPKRPFLGQKPDPCWWRPGCARHLTGLVAAEPFEFPVLSTRRSIGLEPQGQLADLVEEQGALVGFLEPAGFVVSAR
jgi:hypothetical protein